MNLTKTHSVEAPASMTSNKAELIEWGRKHGIEEAVSGFESFYSLFSGYGTTAVKFIDDIEAEYGKLNLKQKQAIGSLFATFDKYDQQRPKGMSKFIYCLLFDIRVKILV